MAIKFNSGYYQLVDSSDKIVSRDSLIAALNSSRKSIKTLGYTSGVFDILHAGHVDYLEKARTQCDYLVVGVNSDASVRANKGEKKPIITEQQRTRLVAALACVDQVFVFSEKNNNLNVELIKPDIYFKAGDYDKSKLTSAPLVESYGGRIVLIPDLPGLSSSKIIENILYKFHPANTETLSLAAKDQKPAVFLDRDGTINEHIEYLHEPEKFKLVPGALEAMKKFQEKGFRIVIVTNQPGIGMGYFTKEDYFRVNKELLKAASSAGVSIDRIYFCPHSKADKCNCRKPDTAMIKRAVEDLNIDLKNSFMIGDMTGDILLGKNVGCKTILVQTGMAGSDGVFEVKPDHIVSDLLAAAKLITTN